jgi:hypothetical protein
MLIYRCSTTAKVVHSSIDASETEVRRLSHLRLSLVVSALSGGSRDPSKGYTNNCRQYAVDVKLVSITHRASPVYNRDGIINSILRLKLCGLAGRCFDSFLVTVVVFESDAIMFVAQ